MLKKRLYKSTTLLLFFSLILFSHIQGQVTWQKTYGWDKDDKARVIKQTNDGGYILVGESNRFYDAQERKENSDILIIRLDVYGDTIWVKNYGDEYWASGHDVIQTDEEGFLVLSNINMYGPNAVEVCLMKTDNNGDTLWTKKYGRYEADYGYSLIETSDKGYMIAGATYSLDAGWNGRSADYVIKVDSTGDFLWDKLYDGISSAKQIINASNGFLFIGTGGFGNTNFRLVKINQYGDTLWTKTYSDSLDNRPRGIAIADDNGFLIAGDTEYTGSFGLEQNILILKIDSTGNLLWEKEYNMSYGDRAKSIQPTTDGGFILSGSTVTQNKYVQALIMKLDENGDSLWTQTFGNDYYDEAYAAEQTDDGGYILTGFTETSIDNDILIVKTDPSGFVTALENNNNEAIKPNLFSLKNHPNPFNQQTVILYNLPFYQQRVSIDIFNIAGQKIGHLFEGIQPSGEHKITWHGLNEKNQSLSSGLYFIQININEGQLINTSKLMLIR